jgi:hypothetical protein
MSCWWNLTFSVMGAESVVEQLKDRLSDFRLATGAAMFHHARIVSTAPGFVALAASRNHGGEGAIRELVERFSDLSFQGSLWNDMGYGSYTLFEGQDGAIRFRDLEIPDFDNRVELRVEESEIEKRIREIDD